jgi:hypothetical protein
MEMHVAVEEASTTFTNATRAGLYEAFPLRRVVDPHENDVLILRTGLPDRYLDHSGNKRFQALLEAHAAEYGAKSPTEKPILAVELLEHWREQCSPGRFLRYDGEANLWDDIGDKKSRERISAMLRKVGSQDLAGVSATPSRAQIDQVRGAKLYGRTKETKVLVETFLRHIGSSNKEPAEICLIQGHS